MSFVGDALHWLASFAVGVIAASGYAGVFLLMTAESMVFPVPSEAVMPFAGFLAARGDLSLWGALVASSAGSLAGSYLSYLMGAHGMLPLVAKYGRFVLIHEGHVAAAQRWFATRGAVAIFVCRFIPGVRHVISIPAGAARMPLAPFFVATFLGATTWNAILLFVGFALGERWEEFAGMKRYLDVAAVAIGLLLVAYVVYEWRKGKRMRGAAGVDAPDARE